MKKTIWLQFIILMSMTPFITTSYAVETIMPDPPVLSAKGYILMDYHTGKVLVERNAHDQLNPASLTKLMTAYVAGQAVKSGRVSLNDPVVISRNAWAKNFPDSSKMFIEVGQTVSLDKLYRGLIIQSGNDASVAIAEHVAGSESAFVSLMNGWADKLNLHNTAFTNPHGLDSVGLYSTPHDIALLSQAIIRDLPNIYPLYRETSYTYNGITQYNRNGLLRDRSINVDGIKTGYTKGAGYSLATSAQNGEMRLIAVVMGTKSVTRREAESKQLLSYGFRFYDTLQASQGQQSLAQPRVWMGKQNTLHVGTNADVHLTLPRSQAKKVNAEIQLNSALSAPIQKNETVGQVLYMVGDKVVSQQPLVALETIEQGNIFKRMMDWFRRLFASWLA